MSSNATSLEPEIDGEALEAELTRLAEMPIVTYDRKRRGESERLGISLKILDGLIAQRRKHRANLRSKSGRRLEFTDIEIWPDPVSAANLLSELSNVARRHLSLPSPECADAIALWIVHTHALDAADITPRLAITAPEKGCGKSTVLKLLSMIVRRPIKADNITSSAMFRVIEMGRPTLLVDEYDTFGRENEELRGVVNSGHDRAGQIIRNVGDDHEPHVFSTFGPVAIACIGKLAPTIEDRSIPIAMRRAMQGEAIEPLPRESGYYETLARKCARLAADHLASLCLANPVVPDGLIFRAADNWRALFAIADLAGAGWPERARRSAMALSAKSTDSSNRVMLLQDIKFLFVEQSSDRMFSAEIVGALGKMEGRPWPEFKNGRAITTGQLARQLAQFDISPSTIRDGGLTAKGYYVADFADAFARYLTAQNVTPSQSAENKGNLHVLKRHSETTHDGKQTEKIEQIQPCDVVTFQNGVGDLIDEGADRIDRDEAAAIRADRE